MRRDSTHIKTVSVKLELIAMLEAKKNEKKNILVIAHYDPKGTLRFDTEKTILAAENFFDKIYFVSTNLARDEEKKIPEKVIFHRRQNFGYDFYSYKVGIDMAKSDYDFISEVGSVTIMNTSILIFDPFAFFEKVASNFHKPGNVCSGISKSYDFAEHLQSYLITFNVAVLSNKNFLDWWERMEPISEKKLVILKHEIGLSVFLKEQGFQLFAHITGNSRRDPTHAYFNEIFDSFKIIKVELIKFNSARINLSFIAKKMARDKDLRLTFFRSMGYKSVFSRVKIIIRMFVLRKVSKFLEQQHL